MNKTLTVNIGGLVFHIDENAYKQLDHYLKTIKASFSIEEQEEIIHDIELRIAELLSERIVEQNQVVNLSDIHQIINIMGKPEDYVLEDEPNKQYQQNHYHYTNSAKKLYRDQQDKILGGVLSGLGHYFGIAPLWIRILFAVLFLFYGAGFLLYIILWIIIPPARTVSQILEMKREPVTISTIEKEVKENIEYVNKKLHEVDYQKLKNSTKNAGEKSARIISYIIGSILLAISSVTILSTIITFIALLVNSNRIIESLAPTKFPINDILNYGYPFWLSILILVAIICLPFIGMFIIGLRFMYSNIKYVGLTIFGLFILWIISLGAFTIPLFSMGVNKLGSTIENTVSQQNFEVDLPNEIEIIVVSPEYFTSDKTTLEGFEVDSTANLPVSLLEIEINGSYAPESYFGVQSANEFHLQIVNTTMSYNTSGQKIEYELQQDKLIIGNIYIDPSQQSSDPVKYKIYIPQNHRVKLHQSALIFTDQTLQQDKWYAMDQDLELTCIDCN